MRLSSKRVATRGCVAGWIFSLCVLPALVLCAGLLLGPAAGPACADEEHEGEREEGGQAEVKQLLNDLEHGMRALRRLERPALARQLRELAEAVAQRLKAGREREYAEHERGEHEQGEHGEREDAEHERREHGERERAERHVEIIKSGVPVLVKAGREEAAEHLEHGAHALELRLQGRRDTEARQIIERAPGAGDMTELLALASELAQKQGDRKRAGWLRELGQFYRARWKREQEGEQRRRGEDEGEVSERSAAAQQARMEDRHPVPDGTLGLLRQAVVGLAEAGRGDAAGRVEAAEHWRRLWAEGGRGPDFRSLRRKAPRAQELAKHLRTAADLWASWHHPKMGRALDRLANELAGRPARAGAQAADGRKELLQRLGRLQRQLDALRAETRELERASAR